MFQRTLCSNDIENDRGTKHEHDLEDASNSLYPSECPNTNKVYGDKDSRCDKIEDYNLPDLLQSPIYSQVRRCEVLRSKDCGVCEPAQISAPFSIADLAKFLPICDTNCPCKVLIYKGSHIFDDRIWGGKELSQLAQAFSGTDCNYSCHIESTFNQKERVLTEAGVVPIITRASKAPAGPATSIDGPPLLKMPPPITALMTMNCSRLCQFEFQSDKSLHRYHTKIIHPLRFCLHCVSLVIRY